MEITKALVSLVAGDLLPLSIVDSQYFHQLMQIADSKYQIPSRKYLSTKLLPQTSSELHKKLSSSLVKADVVCTTVDLWSNRQMRSYYGVTVHYVTDWCLQSAMLACTRFRGSHTGDAIAEEYERIIMSFQLNQKILLTVTDSASNMMKAFSLPGFVDDAENEDDGSVDLISDDETEPSLSCDVNMEDVYDKLQYHVPCFAHVLQLVVKDGLQQATGISKVLSKISSIVSHVRKSATASEVSENEKHLQSSNQTRWNSQLMMIRSVDEKLSSLSTPHKLTSYDRKILEDLVEILIPFETATHCMQGNNIVTSSLVVPCVRVLKSTLEELHHKYSSKFVATLKKSVGTRLSQYEKSETFLIASALDPRFKLKWCSASEHNSIKALLMAKVRSAAIINATDSESVTEAVVSSANKTNNFFENLLGASNSSNPTQDIEFMVDEYLSSPPLPQDQEPLKYWREFRDKYFVLAKLAVLPMYSRIIWAC